MNEKVLVGIKTQLGSIKVGDKISLTIVSDGVSITPSSPLTKEAACLLCKLCDDVSGIYVPVVEPQHVDEMFQEITDRIDKALKQNLIEALCYINPTYLEKMFSQYIDRDTSGYMDTEYSKEFARLLKEKTSEFIWRTKKS